MVKVYALHRLITADDISKRASTYHSAVFHGVSRYVGRSPGIGWRPPATTNTNREPALISRSGRFVPEIFGSRPYELIVSERVKTALANVPGIEFIPVEFERLVDIPMPSIGDFSWWESERDPSAEDYESRQLNPEYEFTHSPDVPRFHESIGAYYSVIGPNIYDIEGDLDDIEHVDLNWSDYQRPSNFRGPKPIPVSLSLLCDCPLIRSSVHLMTEYVFALIAPYIDLDYYAITLAWVGPREAAPMLEAYLKTLDH